jgi:hypothetical protein
MLATLLLTACKETKLEVPETYPVKGKLTDKAGKPIAEAHVQLNPSSGTDNMLQINGTSGADGSFVLQTRHINDAAQKLAREGAPPGEYRVTIMPNVLNDQLKGPPPTVSWKPQTVKIEPKENSLTFEVVITGRR